MNATGPIHVLLAVPGKSPAVLTETVWALAHQPSPVIRRELVYWQYGRPRTLLYQLLLHDCRWARLKDA